MKLFDGPGMTKEGNQLTDEMANALKPIFDKAKTHIDVWQMETIGHVAVSAMCVVAHERIKGSPLKEDY